ncbi:MAG: hypothetical protein ACYC2U_01570 [Candidatus Amoebophilus sp.]
MRKFHILFKTFTTYILLVGFCLEGCKGSVVPSSKEQKVHVDIQSNTLTPDVKSLEGEMLIGQQDSSVTLHTAADEVDAAQNIFQQSRKAYKKLETYVKTKAKHFHSHSLEKRSKTICCCVQFARQKATKLINNKGPRIEDAKEAEAFSDIREVFHGIPIELTEHILSYLNWQDILQIRSVGKNMYRLLTGYKKVASRGLHQKPEGRLNLSQAVIDKTINFGLGNYKVSVLDPHTFPSFIFYSLLSKVSHLPSFYWPYLQGSHVREIDLGVNQIGAEGAEAFARALQGTHVHTVNLASNQMGSKGAEAFGRALQGTQVHTVYLGANQIGAQGAQAFGQNLKGTRVHTVYLGSNQISDQGAEAFGQALQGKCVHTVNLRSNQIGPKGAEAFAHALKGTYVHTVDLEFNQIGPTGAESFARALQGTCVHTVNLRSNQIGAEGAEAFAHALQGTCVHTVNLIANHIGDKGAKAFARALEGTQVRVVDLEFNKIENPTKILLMQTYPHIKWKF